MKNSDLQMLGLQKYQINLALNEIEEQIKLEEHPILSRLKSVTEINRTKKGLANLFTLLISFSNYQINPKLSNFFLYFTVISLTTYLYQIEKQTRQNSSSMTLQELEEKRKLLLRKKEELNEILYAPQKTLR